MMQPPTDNLYKFMAVFGIVLSIGSIGFAHSQFQTFNNALIQLNSQVLMHKHESNTLSSDMDQLERQRLALAAESEESGKPISMSTLDDFKSKIDKYAALNRQLSDKNASDTIKLSELRHARTIMYYYMIACAITLLAGLVVAITGFRLWYLKVQVPEDKKNLPPSQVGT